VSRSAVRLGVVFGRFSRVVFGMKSVTMSDMGVVGRFLMIAVFIVPGCLMMVLSSMFVVFGCPFMVFGCWMTCHLNPPSQDEIKQVLCANKGCGLCRLRSNNEPALSLSERDYDLITPR
jgi:hypothetical protein